MELARARWIPSLYLTVLCVALVVGLPLVVWRVLAEDVVGVGAAVFAAAAVLGFALATWWSRARLRDPKPAPANAKVGASSRWWYALFVVLGVCAGLAPFGRHGFEDSSPLAAALGHGFYAGALLAIWFGARRLRRWERERGAELLIEPSGRFERSKVYERAAR